MIRLPITMVLVLLLALGCGTESNRQALKAVGPLLTVSPRQATIPPLGSLQLAAAVTGAEATDIVWEVLDGADAASISAEGLFQATELEGTYRVRASIDKDVRQEAEIVVSREAENPLVEILPAQVEVETGDTVQFSAHVLGSFDARVEWSTSAGTISQSGLLTAPATPGELTVTAKSLAHPDRTATATVTVKAKPQSVSIALAPLAAEIVTGSTLSFVGSVSGTFDERLAWSVSDANGGTVDSAGNYAAPATPGVFQVIVVSLAAPAVTQAATVTVIPKPAAPVSLALAPVEVSLMAGESVTFSVAILGDDAGEVDWSVQEGVAGGTITTEGLYTAPALAGVYHVTARSRRDALTSVTATVNVIPYVSPVAIAIAPKQATLLAGTRLQFSRALTGVTDTSVAWSVAEGADGGGFSSDGLYTAPITAGTYHVTVASVADPGQFDTAEVTVLPYVSPVTVAIAPTALTLQAGQSFDFEAAVAGTTHAVVDWSVVEGSGGVVTANGTYTAPLVTGTYHIKAVSQADASVSDTATVTVVPYETTVAIALSPLYVTVRAGSDYPFEATVAGAADTSVAWSVDEGPAGGTISTAGSYTAPITPGTYHVRAVAVADPAVEAVATVTVDPATVVVSVAPASVTLPSEGVQQFTADVAGAGGGVYWSVVESYGGVVDSKGLYSAPKTGGTYHVEAVSKDEPAARGEATVTVLTAVTVGVSPSNPTVVTNSTLVLFAIVTGATDTDVTWSVLDADGGSIEPDGTYHAPATRGTYRVRATSAEDSMAFHDVSVRVISDDVWVEVTAPTETVMFGASVLLEAAVYETSETDVTWSLPEADSGTIAQNGSYKAPATGGSYRVRATSVDAPAAFSESTLTVQGPWRRTYDLESIYSGLMAVKRDADGTLWVVGWKKVTTPYESSNYGWVAHLNPDGTVLNEVLLTHVTQLGDLAFMANGNLLVVGYSNVWTTGAYDGVVVSLTRDLEPVWANSYGQSNRNDFFQFVHTVDGATFFVGGQSSSLTTTDDKTALLRIDATGAVQSAANYSAYPGRLVSRPDGSFYLLTVYGGATAIIVRKFSSTGTYEWGKSLTNFRQRDAVPGAWGGIVIAGHNYTASKSGVFELDAQGNFVWGTGLGAGMDEALCLSADSYTVVDRRSYAYANVLWFANFSTTGTVQWQSEMEGSGSDVPGDCVDNGRDGFLLHSIGQGSSQFLLDLTADISLGLPPSSGWTEWPTNLTPAPWSLSLGAASGPSSLSWSAAAQTPVTTETVTPVGTVFE